MSSEKNSAGPTSGGGVSNHPPAGLPLQWLPRVCVVPLLQVLVRVLDHHHRRVHHRANGNGNAAQRHDVGVDALPVHDDEGRQNAQRQRDDGHQGRTQVKQKQGTHHGHHRKFFEQLVAEVLDGPLDEPRAVVGGHDLHAWRQARLQGGQFGFDRRDGGQGVLARAHDDHAAHGFAFAIQLTNAAPNFGANLHMGHVAQQNGHTSLGGHEWNGAEIVQGLQIPGGTHHEFGFAHLQHRGAHFLVGAANRFNYLAVGNSVGGQFVRIEHHLILPHHATDGGNLGHAGHSLELVFQKPVLQAAQLGQVLLARLVGQRVLVNPAHPGRIRPQCRSGPWRQAGLHLVEVFQHPRARPVQVGAILEQHVDVAVAKKRVATHHPCPRH